MASDAHAHPDDLLRVFPDAETERRSLRVTCAASSCTAEEFSHNEALAAQAKEAGAAPLYPCFAVHPQLPSARLSSGQLPKPTTNFRDSLELLETLAAEHRIAAVGETGFDLYSAEFKETEAIQDDLFTAHLEIALRYDIPIVIHVRRAMHKIFPHAKKLKKLPAVVFHSWPGVPEEAFSLLNKGIRAFFSFGTTLLLNHKNAIRSCAALPAEHLLLETDAPYQPLRGNTFSRWKDIRAILAAAAAIRKEAGSAHGNEAAELEEIVDRNFFGVFGRP
jgi:TatD DNase family protein